MVLAVPLGGGFGFSAFQRIVTEWDRLVAASVPGKGFRWFRFRFWLVECSWLQQVHCLRSFLAPRCHVPTETHVTV